MVESGEGLAQIFLDRLVEYTVLALEIITTIIIIIIVFRRRRTSLPTRGIIIAFI